MHNGDRSHPRLVALDRLGALTYAGWRDDVEKAERHHLHYPILFNQALEAIAQKQEMHDGDRSHPRLVVLADTARARPVVAVAAIATDAAAAEVIVKSSDDDDIDADDVNAGAAPLQRRWRRRASDGIADAGARASSRRRRLANSTDVATGASADASDAGACAIGASAVGAGVGPGPGPASEDNECAVCFDGPKSHIFTPCGHVCVCKQCADGIMKSTKQCPICRSESSAAIQTFF
jgi:hypothetical protein